MNDGFIKLHRKFLDWEWYKNTKTKTLFIHCLFKANWKDGNYEGYKIPRGSFVTSVRKLSEELSCNKDKFTVQHTRTALKQLNLTGEITIKITSKFSIITIVNYEKYQSTNTVTNTQLTHNQHTTNNNRRKKEKKEEKEERERNNKEREKTPNISISVSAPPLTLTPALFDIISYGETLKVDKEYCERFYNHYESIGWVNGSGQAIKNWKLVMNNWVKKDKDDGKIKEKIDTEKIYEDEVCKYTLNEYGERIIVDVKNRKRQ